MTAEVMRLKRRASFPIQSARVDALLHFIGVPQDQIPGIRKISKMSTAEKEWLLFDVRKVYLDRIKQAHPDKGGDAKEASDLNLAMNRISHLLTNAPGLFIPTGKKSKPRTFLEANCAVCGTPIKKWHPQHVFCDESCKNRNRYLTKIKPRNPSRS